MTTHVTTHNPVRSDIDADPVVPATRASRRGWAYAGIVAGAAGLSSMVTTAMVDGIYDPDLVGQPDAIAARIAEQTVPMFAFQVIGSIGAVAMVVFAAGLFRRLRSRLDGESLLPMVAAFGLLGTAVVTVMGTGLNTEFATGLLADDLITPSSAVMYNHWIGTIPWVWILAGVSALAVFAAARQGAVPRWIGRTSLVLGGLTVLFGIAPVQYMALMTGALWLTVVAIGFAFGDRLHRAGA